MSKELKSKCCSSSVTYGDTTQSYRCLKCSKRCEVEEKEEKLSPTEVFFNQERDNRDKTNQQLKQIKVELRGGLLNIIMINGSSQDLDFLV